MKAPRHRRGGLHRLRRRQAAARGRPRGPRARRPLARPRRARPRRRGGTPTVSCSTRTACATRSPAATTACMHFAALALVAESVEHPERYWRNNVTGTLNLLDGDARARRRAPRLLLHLRHLRRAGDRPDQRGRADGPGERLRRLQARRRPDARHECRAHGLGATSLRYFNVAGRERGAGRGPRARDPPDPARAAGRRRPAAHISVFGTDYPTRDGTCVRDYIHVEDLGDAHLLALDALAARPPPRLQPRHGHGYTVREVDRGRAPGHGAGDRVAQEEPRRPGDPPELVAAAERARARSSAGRRAAAWTR